MAGRKNEGLMAHVRRILAMHPDMTLKEIRNALPDEHHHWSEPTVKRYVAEARKESRTDLEPWSPDQFDADELDPKLLDVAKEASIGGRKFSRRQARQALKILKLVPDAPDHEVWLLSFMLAFPASSQEREYALFRMQFKPWKGVDEANQLRAACQEFLGGREFSLSLHESGEVPVANIVSQAAQAIRARLAARAVAPSVLDFRRGDFVDGEPFEGQLPSEVEERWASDSEELYVFEAFNYMQELLEESLEESAYRDECLRNFHETYRRRLVPDIVV